MMWKLQHESKNTANKWKSISLNVSIFLWFFVYVLGLVGSVLVVTLCHGGKIRGWPSTTLYLLVLFVGWKNMFNIYTCFNLSILNETLQLINSSFFFSNQFYFSVHAICSFERIASSCKTKYLLWQCMMVFGILVDGIDRFSSGNEYCIVDNKF